MISSKDITLYMVLGYSRMIYAEFTLSIDTPTIIQCHMPSIAVPLLPQEAAKLTLAKWPHRKP